MYQHYPDGLHTKKPRAAAKSMAWWGLCRAERQINSTISYRTLWKARNSLPNILRGDKVNAYWQSPDRLHEKRCYNLVDDPRGPMGWPSAPHWPLSHLSPSKCSWAASTIVSHSTRWQKYTSASALSTRIACEEAMLQPRSWSERSICFDQI